MSTNITIKIIFYMFLTPIIIVVALFIKSNTNETQETECFTKFVFFVTLKNNTALYDQYGNNLIVAEFIDDKPSDSINLIGVFVDGEFTNLDNSSTSYDNVIILNAMAIKDFMSSKGYQKGSQLFSKSINVFNSYYVRINLSEFGPGLYFTYNDKYIRIVYSYGSGNSYSEEYDHIYEVENGIMKLIQNKKIETFSNP